MWRIPVCFFVIYLTVYQINGHVHSDIDSEYEQVIADRYLFSSYKNESSWWSVLENVRSAWQVVSLPSYHRQSSKGFWILMEREGNSTFLELSYFSIDGNGSFVVLSEIDVKNVGSFLVSSNEINRMNDYTAALLSPTDIQLILCNQFDVTSCLVTKTIPLPSSILANTTKISTGWFLSEDRLYIGCDSGLHVLNLKTWEIIVHINEISVPVSSLAFSSKHQTIFIGTQTKLYLDRYINGTDQWRFEHVNGLIDSEISSLVYDYVQDKLWIGQNTGITYLSPIIMSSGRLHWYFSRLGGHKSNPGSNIGHLPLANITSLSVSYSNPSDNCIWLGSIYGLMRFNWNSSEENRWRVFNSGRYLPNRFSEVNISSLTVLNRLENSSIDVGSTAVAITNRGLVILRFQMWTLKEKADHFQKFIDQSDRHRRYNFVSDCSMSVWGDPTTCIKGPNDNDGLWTAMYLASQVFRYVITNDTCVRDTAWTHFQALKYLNNITGISGYPARSIAQTNEFPPSADWHLSPMNSSIQFKGDTSSDEIVGHQFVYPLVHDLLCQTDEERQEVYQLLFDQTRHILTHQWYLVGENHSHTTWGIWNPNEINNSSYYQETRGLNSLQILSFLFQIYAYSGEEQFLDGINQLIDLYDYDVNLINEKMIAICDGSFSDDELAYLSYWNLVDALNKIRSSKRETEHVQFLVNHLKEYFKIGLDLSHQYKQMEKSPFYNFIYCYIAFELNETSVFDCQSLINDGIWYLQRFPLELINWPQYNSQRLDIQINELASCNSLENFFSFKALPPGERTVYKWNNGVFRLDSGDGYSEEDPTIFLLSYWGMKYTLLPRMKTFFF